MIFFTHTMYLAAEVQLVLKKDSNVSWEGEELWVLAGDETSLLCHVEATPRPSLRWEKVSKKYTLRKKRHLIALKLYTSLVNIATHLNKCESYV